MLADYDLVIAANDAKTIALDVDGFVCTDANLPSFKISINDQSASIFQRQWEFAAPPGERIKKLRIENTQAVPLTVFLKAWKGLFRDRRTLQNQVQGFVPQTIQDIGEDAQIIELIKNAVTTDQVFAEIFNPVGSGKLLAVTSLMLSTTNVVANAILYRITTQFAAGVLTSRSKSTVASTGNGKAEVLQTSSAAPPLSGNRLARILLPIDNTRPLTINPPLVFGEGNGLRVLMESANRGLVGYVETLELDG